ncbi:MAG: hypothetical protein Q7S84_04340 [bacterium]|nr:hypothetical protein [bacterium]
MDAIPQSPESFAAHVERVAAALETQAGRSGEMGAISRDAVREAIRSIAEQEAEMTDDRQPTTDNAPPSVVTPVPPTGPTTQTLEVLPEYLRAEGADPAVQHAVESLVTEAFQHGLMHALKLAKSRPPLIEDAFHDALVDIVLPLLKERHRV